MGKKSSGSGTQTTRLDEGTQQYVDYLRKQQQTQYGELMGSQSPLFAGPNALQQQAAGRFGGMYDQLGFMGQAGQTAVQQGMQFDPYRAQQRWQDPYQQQVIGGIQQNFDRQRQEAMMSGSQNAFLQGAGGGSRQAVLQAAMMRDVNQNESQAIGNLLSQGFAQSSGLAMQGQGYANQMANMGFGAMGQTAGLGSQLMGQQFGMGEGLRGIQNQLYQQELYRAQQGLGMIQNAGPYGQSTASSGGGGNPLGSAMGGALSGAAAGSVVPGLGTVAGGVIGGLAGLFG